MHHYSDSRRRLRRRRRRSPFFENFVLDGALAQNAPTLLQASSGQIRIIPSIETQMRSFGLTLCQTSTESLPSRRGNGLFLPNSWMFFELVTAFSRPESSLILKELASPGMQRTSTRPGQSIDRSVRSKFFPPFFHPPLTNFFAGA